MRSPTSTARRQELMRAIVARRYGPPDSLRHEQIDTPTIGDGDVLLRVRAASLNPSDRLFEAPSFLLRAMTGLRRPKDARVGHDVAGEVVAVGSGVSRFRVGDAVFGVCHGAFAEYACAAESRLVDKPEHVTFDEAAATPVAALTALQAVRDKGRLRSGDRVLVNGAAGGVGTFAVQIARALGGRVTGVCSTRNVDLVRSLGAERVIDYTRDDFTRGAERYDVLVDCVGNRPLSTCRGVLTADGRCVLVGAPEKFSAMLGRAFGAWWLSRIRRQPFVMFVAKVRADDLATLRDFLASGAIRPVIDRRYALEEAPAAFRHLETRHARGKIVIVVDGEAAPLAYREVAP